MSLPNPPKEDVKDAKHLATDTTKASGRPEKNQPERLPATPDSNAVQDLCLLYTSPSPRD